MTSSRPSSKVSVPSDDSERPRLLQVGVIAAVCFAIGVLWPTLSGVKLVHEAPSKAKPKVEPKPKRSPATDSTAEVPASKVVPQAPEKTTEATVEIQEVLVVNCRDDEDRRLSSCDTPAFDEVANDRLKALAACPGARDAQGIMSLGFELDFSKGKITEILGGKSSTVGDQIANNLVECAKKEFMSATLKDVDHTHSRYLLFYKLDIQPPGAIVEPEALGEPEAQAAGSATIVWNSARVRAQPEDGSIVTRLLYGTRVVVSGRKGDWYRIRYDAKGSEGWVHKNALAL